MKCQNCGREMKNGARFCIGCGAQHDENGQLIGGNKSHIDYNKTMMASEFQQNDKKVDYDKTMMSGSTGFKQYQPEYNQQNFQQYNNQNNDFSSNVKQKKTSKKKISPIIIICPIIIVGALAFSFINNKKKINKSEEQVVQETQTLQDVVDETIESEVSLTVEKNDGEVIHLKGYWSADAEYFYIDGEMQKNMWVGEYYVGDDGKKVVNNWVDNKYYVDAIGKKIKNEWIEFSFYGEDGRKKTGFYYVGSDGEKVTNKTIDGRYINDEGCYWPSEEEIILNKEKKLNKVEDETKKISKDNIDDSTKETKSENLQETTAKSIVESTAPINAAQITPVSNVDQLSGNVKNVVSDGISASYQIVTQAFSDNKIDKYVSIVVNDTKYPNLIAAVSEWDNNRGHDGFSNGEVINNDNMSITYDININRNDGKIFSIYEIKTKFDNGKAYEKEKTGYTWDASTGEMLPIESIFASKSKFSEFTKIVLNKIKTYKSSFDDDTYQYIIDNEDNSLYDNCTWYMDNNGIIIIFNSNRLDVDKLDGISFTLTYAENGNNINKLLLEKYRK